jgi:hypothetical protein
MNVHGLCFVALLPFACAQPSGAWRERSPHRVQFVTVEEGVRREVLDRGGSARPLVLFAANLSGTWEIDADFDDASLSGGGFDCVFKQEGDRLTGSCQDIPLTGEVREANVKWQIRAGQTQDVITYTGTVNDSGTRINGRFSMAGKGGRFTASKQ